MSLRLRCTALALLAVTVGCPADDTTLPDGGATDLRVEWTGQPATLPDQVSSEATLERAVFRPHDLRVVGDAGPIRLDRQTLEWARGINPAPDVVAGAPPGLYSRLLFDLEGDDGSYGYELIGTARVNSTTRPFTIRDRGELSLSVEFSIMLPAGAAERIPVRVELDKLVEAVDFSQAPVVDGRYLVEDATQLSAVRAKLREAFSVHSAP
ncbi:MAG TPA: hypothetical protein VN253_00385 [Kofleriaceae bacterium]|nr:hypothetical protein [Kofleriaceae bacterium]